MGPAAVLSILVNANTSNASANLTRLQGQMNATAASSGRAALTTQRSWENAGRKMQSVGKTMTRTVSLPAAAVGAVSVKMAMDFEESMEKIHNLVGTKGARVDEWGKEILKLAPELGKAPQELAEALYFVASSGIKAKDAMGVVVQGAKASALGLGETKTVVDATTSAMNAYRRSGLSAADATNILAKAVKLGKGEPEEFAASIGRVIPIASKLGVPFNDVAASLASMTLQGLDAAEATTALRGIFSATFKPTTAASAALEAVGLSAEELRKSLDEKGTLATLQMLSGAFHGNVEEMAKVFPNIRGLVGAFNLTGDSVKRNAEIFDEMKRKTDLVGVGFQNLSKTDAFKVKQSLAELQAAAIDIGTALLPVVRDLADVIATMASAFSSMPKFARDLLIGAIVIGPLVQFVGALLKIKAAWMGIRGAAAGAAVAQAAASGAGGAAPGAAGGALARLAPQLAAALAAGYGITKLAESTQKNFMAMEDAVQGFEQVLDIAVVRIVDKTWYMTDQQRKAAIDFMNTLRDQGKITSEEAQKAKGLLLAPKVWNDLNKMVGTKLGDMVDLTREKMLRIGRTLSWEPEQGRKKLLKVYDRMILGIQKAMDQGVTSTDRGMQQITSILNAKLKLFGFTGTISSILKDRLDSEGLPPKLQGQTGMMVPGSGIGDKVHALLEPGEVVVNRKAVAAMGGARAVNQINQVIPRFAKGGIALPRWTSDYPAGMVSASANNVGASAGEFLLKRAKRLGGPVGKMIRFGKEIASQHFPYVYGGGHGSFSGPYDCSGFVSAILHAGGLTGSTMTTDSLKGWGEEGAGKNVTIGVRGSTGANAHTMMQIGKYFFESGSGHGAASVGGWSGAFPIKRHPPGLQRGGIVDPFDPRSPLFVGWGMQKGGEVPWRKTFGSDFNVNELTTLAKFVGMGSPALMAAIAMAESSGIPGNVGDGGDSIGLWQINKPAWGHTNHWLSNPINNARLAKRIQADGLSNWTMYRNGGYRSFLGGQVDHRKLAMLRGGPTSASKPGIGMSLSKPGPKPTLDFEAINEIRRNMNELLGSANLEALQRYQVGLAQHPLLGIPGPSAPVLEALRPMISPVTTSSLETFKGKQGKRKKLKLRGYGQGGVVPGPVGAPQMAVVHGGETITPGAPQVHLHFANGMQWLEKYIRVEVGKGGRRATRGVNRTPGRAGSL